MDIQRNMLDPDIQEGLSVNRFSSGKDCAEIFLMPVYLLLGTNDIRLNVPTRSGADFQERLVSCHYSPYAPPRIRHILYHNPAQQQFG